MTTTVQCTVTEMRCGGLTLHIATRADDGGVEDSFLSSTPEEALAGYRARRWQQLDGGHWALDFYEEQPYGSETLYAGCPASSGGSFLRNVSWGTLEDILALLQQPETGVWARVGKKPGNKYLLGAHTYARVAGGVVEVQQKLSQRMDKIPSLSWSADQLESHIVNNFLASSINHQVVQLKTFKGYDYAPPPLVHTGACSGKPPAPTPAPAVLSATPDIWEMLALLTRKRAVAVVGAWAPPRLWDEGDRLYNAGRFDDARAAYNGAQNKITLRRRRNFRVPDLFPQFGELERAVYSNPDKLSEIAETFSATIAELEAFLR